MSSPVISLKETLSGFECFYNTPHGPIQKHISRQNFYTPTYSKIPSEDLDFDHLTMLAQRRLKFHQRLEFESQQGPLDYQAIRTISVDFGVPFKYFSNNSSERSTDHLSYFSLMLSSMSTQEHREKFAVDEERLFYYRLTQAGVSAVQINDYFWPSKEIKNLIISSGKKNKNDEEEFLLDYVDAFNLLIPTELEIENGTAHITLDQVYHIVCETFRSKILEQFKKYEKGIGKNESLIESLGAELSKNLKPKAILTIDNIDEMMERSFPPCMHRNMTALKKTHYVTFKARFELCLFFKALGMDYFQQFQYWKKMIYHPNDAWHFESQVIQVLKQIYGLDDAEEDYSPHRCISIINHDTIKEEDRFVQGCPFIALSIPELKLYLKKMKRGIKHAEIEELATILPDNPQRACRRFFDGKFNTYLYDHDGMERPVDYFLASEDRLNAS